MKTIIPWKPNTSGLPDPFFMSRREYLEALNGVAYSARVAKANAVELTIDQFFQISGPRPFDPDTFHPQSGHAVPRHKRSELRKAIAS